MTCPVSPNERRRDYESATGGYCAADGTHQYAAGPETAPAKRVVTPPPLESKPLGSGAKQLVDRHTRSSKRAQVAALAGKSGRTELTAGMASYEKGQGSVSAAEAKLPLAGGELKPTLLSVKSGVSTTAYGGSSGLSVGAGAAVASVEWSYARGHESMSVGVDVGLSAGVSIGTRDANGNGIPETCWSVDAGLSIAACKEDEVPPQADGPTNGAHGAGSRSQDQGAGGAAGW